ncbi:DUF3368 domain-containing protein [Candidatus Bathyarchaeota archaeon]|nr:DUF3368 domain-containing protein [Candidatus Bathyarchaeota archaeon]
MPGSVKIVSDSSPLIWLSKVNKLGLLRQLFDEVSVPEAVRLEVMRCESVDALLIREAFRIGWLKVESSGERGEELVEVSGIHLGEAEAILLARRSEALFLVDDREASVVAQVFGVRCIGSAGVLLSALASGVLGFDEFIVCLDRMIGLGFRLSVEVYRRALEEAKRIATNK